ncbi:peptidylprolyl isomerase [Aureibaculum sp. 2210JD6-5]|uniref:peptidylprolyl isomerase n=1 Tax=Aureibaculum sp. 2210JD6-5 TaxID=3103957 RepID=UPI002AAE9D88|nr:peptidylprolyl isomerase [Aureibaculum sp. 2210JD6-5]MDY7395154.1 peptidylprolyl isomerase [Aureibaculum sp. 2210JD6-5]
MLKKSIVLLLLVFAFTMHAQDSTNTGKRVKLDGVATVVGKNIVLDSEIAAYKLEFEQQSEGKLEISDCEMLEQIMERKLLSHHAVVDSISVTEAEVNTNVERKIAYFLEQLGSEEKVYTYYGFSDMADLRKEFNEVEKEALMVQKMQQKLTEEVDVTPEEVRNYYKSLEDENNLPEIGAEIELQQIVLYAKPSEEETERVLNKLKEIKQQVENGDNFKMKTILYSEDPGVTQNIGLYTITRESQFVTEFKEAAFSLDEGEMSEPFKSDFGYHILQVEKIKGKQRDARHLLMQPEVTEEQKAKVKDSLESIRTDILKLKINFNEAVEKYSEEKLTKANKGFIMNPETNDSKFDLTRLDPTFYARVSTLKEGEISDVFYDTNREGEQMYKIILMKSKTDAHTADLIKDYIKIQTLALQKKKEETIAKWTKEKIGDTYIKINKDYKDCDFKNNWKKEVSQ